MSPATTPTLMTAEEFARKHGGDYVELIDGKVEAIPMPKLRHGQVCAAATRLFGNFITDNGLGLVCSNDTFVVVRRNPDRVRGADLCFWRKDRVPPGELPDLITDPPDLVVEVRSPTDAWTKVFAKVLEDLEAGVRVVVLIDPGTATASVYRPDELQQVHDNGDELTLPDVLPGFSIPVRKFFE